MILYRAMCEKEFLDTLRYGAFSWNSRFKWFGTRDFVESRVMDGKFNNCRFVSGRYDHLLAFDFSDESMGLFEI